MTEEQEKNEILVVNTKMLYLLCYPFTDREAAIESCRKANIEEKDDYKLMTWAEFFQAQREKYITPPKQIDRAEWWDKLEVLPPENWQRGGSFEHFRMMEYWTGTITNQYAKLRCAGGCLYLSKMIDTTDESTWIKLEDFDGLKLLPGDEHEATD
ncbi:hypothetical protein [Parendozoicomonas haliclonae]|uniref:Uncharacterized protein n=1 Tax=Parendozoicomonas haliclonae TaxID=1960125 RepID=A0A1X7AEP4_9GAMM|nr:hypothetical protein [Parendozoicomonas haliclonae]SMA33581.1 hypothetical protein EHSB41UT_00300 [Parendozoicomonas haliclonae]